MTLVLVSTIAAVGLLGIAADDEPTGPKPVVRVSSAGPVVDRCPGAQKAIGFYRQKYAAHRGRMGLPGPVPRVWYPCNAARRRAVEWRNRAAAAHDAYRDWRAYHWDWPSWLPDKWQRVGACETGYGRRPGRWDWNSGTYQGAFGFAVSSWDGFVPRADPKAGPYPSEAYLATPRQQYEVALAIWRAYGFSGWGCRGA